MFYRRVFFEAMVRTFVFWTIFWSGPITAQLFDASNASLGALTPGRTWWDVKHYGLSVAVDPVQKSISGSNTVRFKVVEVPAESLQIDLQEPMQIDSVMAQGRRLNFRREGSSYRVEHPWGKEDVGSVREVTVYFHGSPRQAKYPPWDGGFIWSKDTAGDDWIGVACQGAGASVWWPCKDHQSDEPEDGVDIRITAPERLQAISNGRLKGVSPSDSGNKTWHWQVSSTINPYNVTLYVGRYAHWKEDFNGARGNLSLDFYPLQLNESKARVQFSEARGMLRCFEHWMGPYPFYKDGYKLVEAPFLGMEHQSAIAYGNHYGKGYFDGKGCRWVDRSRTGVGLSFDYIIVHESGHEWFGNSITAADVADNWIHEGLTTYTETLYVECMRGKEAAETYQTGKYHSIKNDIPLIGIYQRRQEGSADIYEKGAALIHMVRRWMNDDERFRQLLRGMSRDFYHRTVSSAQLESYIIRETGLPLAPFFEQYLRTVKIPVFAYEIKDGRLYYRWENVVRGFAMPLRVYAGDREILLHPTEEVRSLSWSHAEDSLRVDPNFYVSSARDKIL